MNTVKSSVARTHIPNPNRALELERASFLTLFPDRPFLVRHNLANHRLFSIDRLLELAKSLPDKNVEYNAGDILPADMGNKLSPRTGLSAEETIRHIRECRSWMVLKNVESDPEYRSLLYQCLDEVQELSESRIAGMSEREGFIFLSSPNSVTPLHVDPEHNFLLQIRGRKNISVFDPQDTNIITEAQIEQGLFGQIRNVVYRDELQSRGQLVCLHPGTGVHVPQIAPHWVKNLDEVSVSFSITFQSSRSRRQLAIRTFNSRLRSLGFKPAPVGRSSVRDNLKYHSERIVGRLHRTLKIEDTGTANKY